MLKIIQGNILDFKGDAIINAANNNLLRGTGVCGAIFEACDASKLEEECLKIGYCETGNAVITSSAGLKNVKYIIHAVAPIYDGTDEVEYKLYNAYYKAMLLAYKNDLKSIAFPSLGTGNYGYPVKEAAKIAIRAIIDFLNVNDMEIYLYAFSKQDFEAYQMEKVYVEKHNAFII